MLPYVVNAARTASAPVVTGAPPATSSMRAVNRLLPSSPSQNVSEDIPRTNRWGWHVITARAASSIVARMLAISLLKSSSFLMGSSGMYKRPKWLVTPYGRIASISGCTDVFVDGAIMPSFRRNPSESTIAGLKMRCALLSLIVLDSGRAPRQIEHADRQRLKIGEDLRGLHHVGIFSIHVAEIDRVASLRAVEAAFLGECDAVIEAEGIEHRGTHAS